MGHVIESPGELASHGYQQIGMTTTHLDEIGLGDRRTQYFAHGHDLVGRLGTLVEQDPRADDVPRAEDVDDPLDAIHRHPAQLRKALDHEDDVLWWSEQREDPLARLEPNLARDSSQVDLGFGGQVG